MQAIQSMRPRNVENDLTTRFTKESQFVFQESQPFGGVMRCPHTHSIFAQEADGSSSAPEQPGIEAGSQEPTSRSDSPPPPEQVSGGETGAEADQPCASSEKETGPPENASKAKDDDSSSSSSDSESSDSSSDDSEDEGAKADSKQEESESKPQNEAEVCTTADAVPADGSAGSTEPQLSPKAADDSGSEKLNPQSSPTSTIATCSSSLAGSPLPVDC